MEYGNSLPRPAVAIIGMGCRMPQADGVAAFWQLLANEVDAIGEVPPLRWDADALWSDDSATPGKTYCRWGGFIPDGDCFDAGFFGIGQTEAASMDPQQGLVLEVAWQALEHAAIPADRLRGSDTGVFVGISNNDYDRKLCSELSNLTLAAGTGTSYSIVANRISYALGLCGPSIAIDLACSSSLVAVHLACQSLALHECCLALAGGVHLILSPEKTITFSRGNVLARDGRCKSFAAGADGYVRGEGCGIVVLKRLDEAVRDADPIIAVIRGSAVNHNGASNGLSAPLGAAQERVIRRALSCATVPPRTIGYVEAHSPGTLLGDLIEARAAMNALSADRTAEHPCFIGSVKANVGHLEAAAGVASLIKAAMMLEQRWIPATLHSRPLNPRLPFAASSFSVPHNGQAWLAGDTPRRAGVSSFSFGGANAHVVLEEAPPPEPRQPSAEPPLGLVLPISARNETSLRRLAASYAAFCLRLAADTECASSFADLCFTASCGRTHLSHRLAIVASGATEAAATLQAFAAGDSPQNVFLHFSPVAKAPTIEFSVASAGFDEFHSGCGSAVRRASGSIGCVLQHLDGYAVLGSRKHAALQGFFLLRYCGVHPSRVYAARPQDRRWTAHLADGDVIRMVGAALGESSAAWAAYEMSPRPDEPDTRCGRDVRRIAIVLDESQRQPERWLARSIAAAYVAGTAVHWSALYDSAVRKVRLPTYEFERCRHWHAARRVDHVFQHSSDLHARQS
jgi:acyl transferase domain-containing protein